MTAVRKKTFLSTLYKHLFYKLDNSKSLIKIFGEIEFF